MLCPKQPIRIGEGICGNRLSCLRHNLPIAPVSNVLMRLDCHLYDLRILAGQQIWENIHSESDFFYSQETIIVKSHTYARLLILILISYM